jgi:signal transduction histidine kinase/response regulator of citrate/malate metabolism
MEEKAFIRKGFKEEYILKVPDGPPWVQFKSPPLRIMDSPLPDLPKRKFLSPFGNKAQEFTILIPVEIEAEIKENPGIFLGYIGENWEIYFNGNLVLSEMHINESGKIISRRNWRDVYFPLEKTIFNMGTNILAIRILGDPSYGVTGLYYTAPYYMDEYSNIKKQHQNLILMLLCGIFGYTGFYYLSIYLSVRKKEEIFNLYYGLFSLFLCIYAITGSGIINNIIPNSDIQIRLEYFSLFLSIPILCIFVEQMGWQKTTIISRIYFAFSLVLAVTQVFFCNQYGDEVLTIWSILVLLYFSYVFVYDIIYFYFFRQREKSDTFLSILIGSVIVYACGIWDVLDVVFFYSSLRLFLYSTFVFHIIMAYTLSNRFRGMYNRLENSNIILETAVHERTRELKKQTEIAVEASQAKSRFLAIMSHEIRTPMNAVIGLAEIELRDKLPEKTRENINRIRQSGSTLLGIINDILDISKIEAGSFTLIPSEYETADIISNVVNLNKVKIEDKPFKFILEIGKDFPAKLYGDELRVKQILNNLLSNAIKYTEKGSVTLKIEYEKIQESYVKVHFIVQDTGIGIKNEEIGKLFSDYTQLDTKSNRKAGGTGLGLSITKYLVEMMGGSINVESQYGKGSVFQVTVIQGIDESVLSIGEEKAKDLCSFSYLSTKIKENEIVNFKTLAGKVLVVDDVKDNIIVAKGLLKPYGVTVHTASSGQEALEAIAALEKKNESYDLILMDHMMPEMDGIETLNIIRSKGLNVPVIALTANAFRGVKEIYVESGFQDYLSKPINPKELDEVINRWLETINNEQLAENKVMSAAMDAQKVDILNHYLHSFQNRSGFDIPYFKKFVSLIESFNTDKMELKMKEQAALLADSGRRADVDAIREALPYFYTSLKDMAEQEKAGLDTDGMLDELLQKLKDAILDGESETAEDVLRKLGALNLDMRERELYFLLYDLMLEGNNEKAAGAINLWERLK